MDKPAPDSDFQPIAGEEIMLERRRSFERRLSEYSGYALLAMTILLLAGLIATIVR